MLNHWKMEMQMQMMSPNAINKGVHNNKYLKMIVTDAAFGKMMFKNVLHHACTK